MLGKKYKDVKIYQNSSRLEQFIIEADNVNNEPNFSIFGYKFRIIDDGNSKYWLILGNDIINGTALIDVKDNIKGGDDYNKGKPYQFELVKRK